jgi:hypothetical protein
MRYLHDFEDNSMHFSHSSQNLHNKQRVLVTYALLQISRGVKISGTSLPELFPNSASAASLHLTAGNWNFPQLNSPVK